VGSLCPVWRSPSVVPVALPGGHFLREDDALVAATLLRAIG
jgi:type IV secretory pathway VirJ component